MNRSLTAGIGFVVMVGLLAAQDKKTEDRVKVEVFLATEHVPKDLKAGARVDLAIVTGKTTAPNRLTVYSTTMVAKDVEVASIAKVDKPENPEMAMRVHLWIPKDLAEKVEKTRDKTVNVVERLGDGTVERKTKKVTLRIDLPKSDKK